MRENKLLRLLAALDRKEMTRFRELAYSPYFNKHKDLRALIAYLSDQYPNFHTEACTRPAIAAAIFVDEPYDQRKLALVFTYALRLFDLFLSVEQYRQTEGLHQLLLLQALRIKKQYGQYEKVLKESEDFWNAQHTTDHTHYDYSYRLAAEANNYYNQIERRRTDHSIQLKQNNLDKFYILEKLKDACEMQVRRTILNVDYSARMLESVLREVGDNAAVYAGEPLILLYYQIYCMVTQHENTHYFNALQTLQQHEAGIAKQELYYIYNYFQNYCIQQINRGEEQFLGEIFKLYQAQLSQGLLVEDGYLSEWHYKNITTTGIRLGEMDWVRQFIEAYRDRLPPESLDNAYRFNLASYYYATHQYDQVLNLLTQVEYSDLRYNLGAKALLLRTYYDLDEYEALCSLTQSFLLYLRRDKLLADFQREGHKNLFKFARQAARIRTLLGFAKPEQIRQDVNKLRQDINATTTVFNKSWLLEKITELESSLDIRIL